jgi:hypothetical protein
MYILTVLINVQCQTCKGFGTFCADTERDAKVKARFSGWDVDTKIKCGACKAKDNPAYFKPTT